MERGLFPLNAAGLRRAALPALAFAALVVFYLRSLGHPSLWLDEAWEANYYLGIVPEPWYNRPVLYMAAVRLATRAFGPGEFALRLLPCLAGLATIAATWALVRRTLGSASAWLAAALLAIAPTFIYESHQLKHYTFDALFTALLLISYLRYREGPSHRRLAELTLTGLVSFGFSFTSIFVLAAIGAVHVVQVTVERLREAAERAAAHQSRSRSAPASSSPESNASRPRVTDFALFLGANVLLVAAFAAIYGAFHARAQGDTLLKDYFVDAWAPLSHPLALPGWLARQTRVLGEIAGASSFLAFALLLAAGAWREIAVDRGAGGSEAPAGAPPRRAASKGASLPVLATVLAGSLLVILFASVFRLYPYGSSRLTLFLAPLVAALAAAGMLEALGIGMMQGRYPPEPSDPSHAPASVAPAHRADDRSRPRSARPHVVRRLAVAGLLYVLMYPAISGAGPYLSRGWGTDELGRNVAALARAHAPGEGIYVPERAACSFVYYWWRSGKGTNDAGVVWGERHRLHPKDHAGQIAKIADTYPSLWVIFDDQSREERDLLLGFLRERYESVRREGIRDAESLVLFRRRDAGAQAAR